MNAVVAGFSRRSGRTSGTVIQVNASVAKNTAGAAINARKGHPFVAAFTDADWLPTRPPRSPDRFGQRADDPLDIVDRRAGSHETDAPDLAGERSKAGADLDAVMIEQSPAHGGFIDFLRAVRHAHGIQAPQALGRGWKK